MRLREKFFYLVLLPALIFFMSSFSLFSQKDGEEVVIGKYRVIHSNILNEDRTLLVHLPRGYEDGVNKFRELKANPQPPIYLDEKEFNELGYRFMQTGKMGEALEIFKLNVELYPKSANVYDSLGEAYFKKGEKEKAIENYRKSLELNPKN